MLVTPSQAQKILSGDNSFSMLAFSMFITRIKGDFKKDSSQAALLKYAADINAFIGKYEAIMSKDLAIISKL